MTIKKVKMSDGKIIELNFLDDDNSELSELREELLAIQKKILELTETKETPEVITELDETKADLKKTEKTFLEYLKGE